MSLLPGCFCSFAATFCDARFFFFLFFSFYSKHFLLELGVLPVASAAPTFLPTIELVDRPGPSLPVPPLACLGPGGRLVPATYPHPPCLLPPWVITGRGGLNYPPMSPFSTHHHWATRHSPLQLTPPHASARLRTPLHTSPCLRMPPPPHSFAGATLCEGTPHLPGMVLPLPPGCWGVATLCDRRSRLGGGGSCGRRSRLGAAVLRMVDQPWHTGGAPTPPSPTTA